MTVGADSAFFDLAVGGIDGVEVDFERVIGKLKPGAHLLALSPIATHHSNTISIEDAGMEIRDTVVWVFDSGGQTPDMVLVTVARKPLEGTVAANVLAHGTGGLNVDGCRVQGPGAMKWETPRGGIWSTDSEATAPLVQNTQGRWPANLIHDNSPSVVAMFPNTGSGNGKGGYCYAGREYDNKDSSMFNGDKPQAPSNYNDNGTAARFFYSAPCLDSLIAYMLKLITQPNGTVLTNCDKDKLPNGYNYVGQEL